MMKACAFWLALTTIAVGLTLQSIPFPGPGAASVSSGPPLTNLLLWVEADCVTMPGGVCTAPADGTTISAWADQSGNANNLSLDAGTCTLHTSVINGKPAVTFSACRWSIANNIAAVADHQIFVVIQLDAASSGTILSGTGGGFASGACAFWYGKHSGKYQGIDKDNVVELGFGTASTNTNWNQANTHYKNGDTSTPTFRLNEVDDAGTRASAASCDLPINKVGYNASPGAGGENFPGKVAAILYYQTNSGTLVDRSAVETYLFNKYGV